MKKARKVDTEAVTKREPVKVPEAVVNDLVGALRGQFLADCPEKRWFAHERPLLVRAVTYPAWFLNNKSTGAALSWRRYQEIIFGVMTAIKHHGRQEKFGSFGRYFFKAVQDHMTHHWEDYYVESKAASNAIDLVMSRLQPGERPAADSTVQKLAELHTAVVPRGGRKKKVVAAEQPSLF